MMDHWTENDWPPTVALPGVVSEGTLKTEDLLLKFIPVYRDLDPDGFRNGSVYCGKCLAAYPESHSFGDFAADTKNGEELRASVLGYLVEALEELAPEGYYFGTQEGDGACFGFFEVGSDNLTERLDPDNPDGMIHCETHGRHLDGTNHTENSCRYGGSCAVKGCQRPAEWIGKNRNGETRRLCEWDRWRIVSANRVRL